MGRLARTVSLGYGDEKVARFVTLGLAEVRVIEFRASQRAKDIQARIDGESNQK